MANLQKTKKDTLAYIDVLISILEKFPKTNTIDSFPSLAITASPFDLLIDMFKSLGCYDEMQTWLIKFLTATLPAVELGVKGIILSNIKATISCSSDPRIPNYMRKPNIGDFTDDDNDKGILLNIGALDYNYLMRTSPLTEYGRTMYLGTDGINNTFQLARAKDFNAFMWFAIHKANFPSPTVINDNVHTAFGRIDMNIDKNNLLGEAILTPTANNSVLVGNTFIQRDTATNSFSSVLNICIDAPRNEEGKIIKNTILPVSSDWKSCNWYVNNGTYFDFLKPENKRKPRDYSKEKAICNLKYVDSIGKHSSYVENTQNNLQLTILPKPFVHLPHKGEPLWRIQRILFNEFGEADKNGKYSCRITNSKPTLIGNEYVYDVIGNSKTNKIVNTLFVNITDGTYRLEKSNTDDTFCGLYECYPGLTIYEWNYDFVMGMQLFDAKVVTARLINLLVSIELGPQFSLSKTQIEGQKRIAEVVKKIIESDAAEVSDCYFTFSNDTVDRMSQEAELKQAKQQPFEGSTSTMSPIDSQSIINILNEYNEEGTLEENKEVITRAINQVSASITQGIEPEEVYGIQVDIITNLVQGLVNCIVDTILSPKMVMLFEVNKRLMGDSNESLNMEDFLKAIMGIIVAIIKEIRDLILQELLDFLLEILMPLLALLADKLLQEQLDVYTALIRKMLKECSFKFGKRAEYESDIDEVTYADIDQIEQPKTSDC